MEMDALRFQLLKTEKICGALHQVFGNVHNPAV